MTGALMDRIKAHRSAPDVYDPPTLDQMANRIEELEASLAEQVEWVRRLADDLIVAEAKLAKAVRERDEALNQLDSSLQGSRTERTRR